MVTSPHRHVHAGPTSGLPEYRGELRSGARTNLLMGVASNRVDVRQAAARVERSLERIAEPLSALVLPADEWPAAFLELAWLEVIRNAAHDSICACSHDDVCLAVLHRYAEAGQIADGLISRALRAVARQSPAAGPVIVNPSARTRGGVVEIDGVPTRVEDVPPYGWSAYVAQPANVAPAHVEGTVVDNGLVRVEVDTTRAQRSRSAPSPGWAPSSTVAMPATRTTTARPHKSCSSMRRSK